MQPLDILRILNCSFDCLRRLDSLGLGQLAQILEPSHRCLPFLLALTGGQKLVGKLGAVGVVRDGVAEAVGLLLREKFM